LAAEKRSFSNDKLTKSCAAPMQICSDFDPEVTGEDSTQKNKRLVTSKKNHKE